MPKLAISGLKAYYMTESGPLQAVDGINLELQENESIGIVGESGSGKSSLGAALMRSMRPPGKLVGGSIMVDDVNIGMMPESSFNREIRWKKIAMVFQGAKCP